MIPVSKKRLFEILEKAQDGDLSSKIFDIFISILICLNITAVILETVEILSINYRKYFDLFELFSVVVFSIEYLFRLWACTQNDEYSHPILGRVKFAITPLALVDLIAVLPFYLPLFINFDLRFIRALRLLRLLRLLKLGRYSDVIKTFTNVFKREKEALLITILILLIMLITSASLMYFIEKQMQPKVFSSIPAAMWWGIATLTTVGYGDIYPITPLGKFLGAIIAFLGIAMFALPAGILSSGFAEEIQRKKGNQKTCPHCGKNLEE